MAGKKRDDLRIVGNGAAERARKQIKKNREDKKSRLDKIMSASRAAHGIKAKKGEGKTR